MCRKVSHFTEESARGHARSLKDRSGAMPNIYKCTVCGFFHVGFGHGAEKLSKRARRERTFVKRKKGL